MSRSYRRPLSKCNLREIVGDLFTCRDSIAHCVSEDLQMSAGIAKIFRQTFKRVDELQWQNKRTGEVAILNKGDRFIYYLVSKKRYFNKPTLNSLKQCLIEMRNHAHQNQVERIGMPLIGCGLDKLKWYDVKNIIHGVFTDSPVEITVYKLDDNPKSTPRSGGSGRKKNSHKKKSGGIRKL